MLNHAFRTLIFITLLIRPTVCVPMESKCANWKVADVLDVLNPNSMRNSFEYGPGWVRWSSLLSNEIEVNAVSAPSSPGVASAIFATRSDSLVASLIGGESTNNYDCLRWVIAEPEYAVITAWANGESPRVGEVWAKRPEGAAHIFLNISDRGLPAMYVSELGNGFSTGLVVGSDDISFPWILLYDTTKLEVVAIGDLFPRTQRIRAVYCRLGEGNWAEYALGEDGETVVAFGLHDSLPGTLLKSYIDINKDGIADVLFDRSKDSSTPGFYVPSEQISLWAKSPKALIKTLHEAVAHARSSYSQVWPLVRESGVTDIVLPRKYELPRE